MKNIVYSKSKQKISIIVLLYILITISTNITAATVYTPLGSPVTASYSEVQWNLEDYYITSLLSDRDAYYNTQYTSTIEMSDYTEALTYNCHSYAWHSQSSPNYYWINIPAVYMSDGSYSLVAGTYGPDRYTIPSGIREYTNKVYYGAPDDNNWIYLHSGITVPNTTNYVLSKWGQDRLYKHYVWDCPYYNYTNATYYYR